MRQRVERRKRSHESHDHAPPRDRRLRPVLWRVSAPGTEAPGDSRLFSQRLPVPAIRRRTGARVWQVLAVRFVFGGVWSRIMKCRRCHSNIMSSELAEYSWTHRCSDCSAHMARIRDFILRVLLVVREELRNG